MMLLIVPIIGELLALHPYGFDNKMITLYTKDNDWIPAKSIKASYVRSTISGMIVHASFKWNTSIPTLNLDNFDQIQHIDCFSDMVQITFDKSENANIAFEAWSNTDDLAIMLGHEHQCKGHVNTTVLSAAKIFKPIGKYLSIDTKPLILEDVLKDYELNVREYSKKVLIARARDHRKSIDFDFNLNKNDKTAIKSNIELRPFCLVLGKSFLAAVLTCNDCHLQGSASYNFFIVSIANRIRRYKFTMHADIEASMDINVDFYLGRVAPLPTYNLANIPLTTISIPGIMHLGPSFQLDLSFDLKMVNTYKIGFGYDYKLKFNFAADTRNYFDKPRTYIDVEKRFNPHPFKGSVEDSEMYVFAHMMPRISIGLNVLNHNVLGVSLAADNQFGIKVETSVDPNCNPAELYAFLYTKNMIDFEIAGPGITAASLNLFNTGDVPLNCTFCKLCPLE